MNKNLEEARKELETFDKKREEAIKQARTALKEAKKTVYALHRNEKTSLATAEQEIQKARKLAENELRPIIGEAEEEYVEAACFASYPEIPEMKKLGVDAETFLAGLCDCIGELVRKAMNSALKKDYKITEEIRNWIQTTYDDLQLIDLRNGNVRRKFDSIKYGLERLENVLATAKTRE